VTDDASDPIRRQRVLVVDDEVDIGDSLRDLLEAELEIDVVVATSGPDALTLLEKEAVDLIITDYRMPGMTGLEFLAAAQKIAPGSARMLITAYPDLDIALKAINLEGVHNFLVKPFDPDVVVENVFSILRARRADELRARAFARSLDAMRHELGRRT